MVSTMAIPTASLLTMSLLAWPLLLRNNQLHCAATSYADIYDLPTIPTFAITNVWIYDGEQLSATPQSVVLRNGTVTNETISTNTTALDYIHDGQGAYLVPGLIDTHVHVPALPEARLHLEEMRAQGITTAFDQACFGGPDDDGEADEADAPTPSPSTSATAEPHCRRHRPHDYCDRRNMGAQDRYDELDGPPPWPLLYFSYAPAVSANSTHARALRGSGLRGLTSMSDVDAWIAARVAEPSRHMKLILDQPRASLGPEAASRIARAAHAAGKVLVCHAASYEASSIGVAAGCAQLHHAPMDRAVDAALAAQIKAAGIPVAPTLIQMRGIAGALNGMWVIWAMRLFEHYVRRQPWRDVRYDTAVDSVRALHAAGVPLLVGTDATGGEAGPVIGTVDFKDGFRKEVKLLRDAGVPDRDILRGATSLPAKYFDRTDRGVIAPGKRADLVLLGSNPLVDLGAALEDVREVWIQGRNHRRSKSGALRMAWTGVGFDDVDLGKLQEPEELDRLRVEMEGPKGEL